MATETRLINFTNAEVKEALNDLCQLKGQNFPEGEVSLLFFNEGEMGVSISSGALDRLMSFDQHEIAAAIIRFCRKKKIPVPRRSHKSLQITQNTVTLQLTLESEE